MLKKILVVLLILFPTALYLYIASNNSEDTQKPAEQHLAQPQDQH
jgi:hypothetical protein